tara:strand:- start:1045 stop:1272 length:228 start_codon:yes stop_codon:yes gene_type:complete
MSFEIVDGKAVIHSFDRENKIGYEKERELPQVSISEGEGRIVKTITLAPYKDFSQDFAEGKTYEVANPQHIFSYS